MCFGSWSRKDLIRDVDVIRAIDESMGKRQQKRKMAETKSGEAEDQGEELSKRQRQAE